MYQFFVDDAQVHEHEIVIEGSDVNHIRNVLRMKIDERIRISNMSGKGTELGNRITLFQGLPKGDKMELIIQKAVELGVYKIVPVSMKNCVVKLDEKKAAKKVERWQAIAESAAKQSKRTIIPLIDKPVPYKLAL